MPPVLGGSEKCPKCSQNVYFAEEIRAMGRKYHKQCLKCKPCGKILDSTNCNDHEDDIYCNTCYRRNFGPNSSVPGTAVEVESSKAPAGSDVCQRCGKVVYMAERCTGGGKYFHKRCFRCNACGVSLDSNRLSVREEEIYCRSCYGKNFGPKGYGFAGGASGLSMDTGKLDDIPTSHIPALAQAHTAPILSEGGEIEVSDWNDERDRCNRCRKVVYFAEKVTGIGKVYHKVCFKCSNCNKGLDSTTVTEHAGEAYCKACYGKNFGPKGYGFAGGASGLSMDTGKLDDIPTSHISALAQAHTAPLFGEGGDEEEDPSDDRERCNRCRKVVYFAERVTGIGKVYHKVCFKCSNCNKGLDSTTVTDHAGQAYCKACYGKNFGPKGYGFAGGASGLSMDTGKLDDIPTSNIPALAQAHTAPLMSEGGEEGEGDWSDNRERCNRCRKVVYFAERATGVGKVFHKVCFKCTNCNKSLDSTTVTEHSGQVYCKACYTRNFGPKGFGFGVSMVTEQA